MVAMMNLYQVLLIVQVRIKALINVVYVLKVKRYVIETFVVILDRLKRFLFLVLYLFPICHNSITVS